jgi:hypothetical protein
VETIPHAKARILGHERATAKEDDVARRQLATVITQRGAAAIVTACYARRGAAADCVVVATGIELPVPGAAEDRICRRRVQWPSTARRMRPEKPLAGR